MKNQIFIVILNWNGWEDSKECLESLLLSDIDNYKIILVDNHSEDNSLKHFNQWQNELDYRKEKIILIQNSENYGFAKGNNIGIDFAIKHEAEYIFLLNNDTIVEKNTLKILYNYFCENMQIDGCTPQIRYYDKPETIWNCGGKLIWNIGRKYFYSDANIKDIPNVEKINITFVTGCALFLRTKLINEIGSLSERFFFGEEDFEFSLRMRVKKKKMICLTKSIIYHKVSKSISVVSKSNILGKIYLHYLNRFINLKDYLTKPFWHLLIFIYMIYITMILKTKHGVKYHELKKFFKLLYQQAKKNNSVSREDFQNAFKLF